MNIIFRSWLYDFLYTIGDQLIKTHNPCQIQKDAAGGVRCLSETMSAGTDRSLCCTNCRFLEPNGCTTRCLGCKLSLCGIAMGANLELNRILGKMRTVMWKYDMGGIRVSKEEVFHQIIYMKQLKDLKGSLRKKEDKNVTCCTN